MESPLCHGDASELLSYIYIHISHTHTHTEDGALNCSSPFFSLSLSCYLFLFFSLVCLSHLFVRVNFAFHTSHHIIFSQFSVVVVVVPVANVADSASISSGCTLFVRYCFHSVPTTLTHHSPYSNTIHYAILFLDAKHNNVSYKLFIE